eukprot:6468100-Amphidinium_carterae.1
MLSKAVKWLLSDYTQPVSLNPLTQHVSSSLVERLRYFQPGPVHTSNIQLTHAGRLLTLCVRLKSELHLAVVKQYALQ